MRHPSPADSRLPKRAIIYLRVSTAKQAGRAEEDVEGYSLPAQREACVRKAAELGAEVIGEYVDRGESAKTSQRPQFLAMLAYVQRERNVDYVICDKVDRFARNRRDDANLMFELRSAGAHLVSVKENIDETPAGQLLHAIMAGIAEYYSKNLAAEALKGMTQKARIGGTPGRAPIGYLNIGRRIDGREVRTVEVDPDRAPLVRWAFEAYATGEWTIVGLTEALHQRGLRAQDTRRGPAKPMERSRVHHMLTNPYYTGIVTFAGVPHEGRHQPLVSQQTFDAVQRVLQTHRFGEKQRIHNHYLKGTVFCGRCGSRLCFGRAKGHGGTYEYFFCVGRHQKRTDCRLAYLAVDEVEQAVERHWAARRQQLPPNIAERVRANLRAEIDRQRRLTEPELALARARVLALAAERRRLADEVVRGRMPGDLASEQRARIEQELRDAKSVLQASELVAASIDDQLTMALQFVDRCWEIYRVASNRTRRLANQVFFDKLLVSTDLTIRGELSEPFATLLYDRLVGVTPDLESDPDVGALVGAGVFSGQGSKEIDLAGERVSGFTT